MRGGTPLIAWIEGILGPYKRGGDENVVFKCPFHSGGRHGGWSFTMHIHTGLCNCKSCGDGWTLYSFLEKLGRPGEYGAIKDAGVVSDAPRVQKVARKRSPKMLPEEVLYLFPYAYGKLPFPDEVIKAFNVRHDREKDRIVYPIRDQRKRLRALHYRANTKFDWETRYRFYSVEEFAAMEVPYDQTGKDECFVNGHVALPLAWNGDVGRLIITEGPKQSMRVHEAGYPNVLGVMGAMSAEQLRVLTRFDVDVWIFTDQNKAGKKAAWSYKGKLQYRSVRAHIVDYLEHEAEQPDEMPAEDVRTILEENFRRNHGSSRKSEHVPAPEAGGQGA